METLCSFIILLQLQRNFLWKITKIFWTIGHILWFFMMVSVWVYQTIFYPRESSFFALLPIPYLSLSCFTLYLTYFLKLTLAYQDFSSLFHYFSFLIQAHSSQLKKIYHLPVFKGQAVWIGSKSKEVVKFRKASYSVDLYYVFI